jgi:hypothetical protein
MVVASPDSQAFPSGGDMSGSDPHWVQVLERLDAALGEAAEVPVGCLSAAELRSWTERLGRGQSRLGALVCRALVEPDWSVLDPVRGKNDVAELVASDRSTDPRPVSGEVRLGRWLAGYPEFLEAFVDGRLSRSHIQALRRCHNWRTKEYLAEAQGYLVQAAVDCDWQGFVAVVHRWVLSCDPDGAEPREQAERRSCRISKQADGSWDGRFALDPVAGHALATALAREEQVLWREDEADEESTRTASQRRADALVDLVTRGSTADGSSGSAPLVHVVLSERVAAEALERLASGADGNGALPADPDHRSPESGHDDPDRRCELIDGTPIHPHHALAVLTIATLRRLVLGADGEILDLGRSVRTFPVRLRQALLARDRGRCRHPGCTSPLAWLQADHVIPWIRGGRTSLANGQMLCDPHNKHKRDREP